MNSVDSDLHLHIVSGDLIVTNSAPVPELQSKFNAAVEGAAKVASVVATLFSSWLFAFSADTQIVGGYLVWIWLAVASLAVCKLVFSYRDPAGWRTGHVVVHGSPR